MAHEKSPVNGLPTPAATGRQFSPPPQQPRHRPLTRASTSADKSKPPNRRRSSLLSDNLSETRRSFHNSAEDLLFPRPGSGDDFVSQEEGSHWHSFPLGLAIFPAIAGLFFQNGSALITDLSLLSLAAIFLNWTVRAPWAWYRSAQAVRTMDPLSPPAFEVIEENEFEDVPEEADVSPQEPSPPSKSKDKDSNPLSSYSPAKSDVRRELQLHELMALVSCFLMPAFGAWLLHTIRSQLSRPSEGLISNYNLTVFLLAAELRPVSHVMKMIEARTLYLQRVINAESASEDTECDKNKVVDLTKRLEELEAHISDAVEAAQNTATGSSDQVTAKATAQATSELRKGFQPELDALNRAVRRYEKRTTISAIQTEARLQDLETRLKDVVVLAAAAQRNAESRPNNFIVILINWLCGAVVLPVQYSTYILTLPLTAMRSLITFCSRMLNLRNAKSVKEQRSVRPMTASRVKERKIKLST